MNKQYFRNLLRSVRNPTIFEIGAADGIDTLEFIQSFKDVDFQMHCFEPDPRNIETFKESVNDSRVRLFEGVVGNITGRVPFYQSTHNRDTGQEFIYSSSLREPADKLFEIWPVFQDRDNFLKIEVESIRLDDFIIKNKISFVDMVFMDVQGAEDLVFEGGYWTFNNITDYIYTEINNEEIYIGAPSIIKMLALLPNFSMIENLGADALFKNKLFLER